MRYSLINKSNRGSILVSVLMIFLVLFLLTTSILYINMANVKQAISQENNLQAYYLAYAGIELGYAALMADDQALFNAVKGTANYSESDSVTYGENNEDEIAISIKSSYDKKTITITSTGIHNKSNKTSTLIMSFPVDFPYLRTWD